ncbi:hypothetical protein CW745_13995 [Psychromonas sp. psych-6C06]|uniref:phage regulatory CII family protein n=1 Tax=Psychromonas sp. psych-6C06 TaxID=2058089 RepID=UPI000C34B9C6|nr:phage regulatory CII family protein [Psychromonas sp. psych-6C06]PKF60638.1 hypothetical protein CW745_13995 [Psychromonas sp. psych-6C06]
MNALEIEVHRCAHEFGVPRLAKMMALNEQSLRNKLCPTNSTAKLSVAELDAMCACTGDLTPLHVLANSHGVKLVPMTEQPQAISQAMMLVMAEVGDVARVIPNVVNDGFMSARECSMTVKEIREAIDSLNVLLVSVESRKGQRV